MSMEGASSAPAASTPSPAAVPPIDPVHTAWPKMKNPGEGTLAGHQPGPPSRVKPEKQAASVSTPKAASQPLAGPNPSKPSPLVQTSIPENSDRPSLAKALMPEGKTLNTEKIHFSTSYIVLRTWSQTRRTFLFSASIRRPGGSETWGGHRLGPTEDRRSGGDQKAEDGIP